MGDLLNSLINNDWCFLKKIGDLEQFLERKSERIGLKIEWICAKRHLTIFLLILLFFGLSIGTQSLLRRFANVAFLPLAKDAFFATTPHYAFILASRENPQVGHVWGGFCSLISLPQIKQLLGPAWSQSIITIGHPIPVYLSKILDPHLQ